MAAARIINFIESLQEELIKESDKNSLFDPPYTTFDLGVLKAGQQTILFLNIHTLIGGIEACLMKIHMNWKIK